MKQSLWIWGLLLIFGFPILTIILGELKSYLQRQDNPLQEFINNLQKIVLPPLVILLILQKILHLQNLGTTLQILETVLWFSIIYTAFSLIKVILVTDEKQYSWQVTIPNIFFQVARGAIVLGVGTYILGEIWKLDLTQVVAALGVGSIVVALALQDTLSNLVSGFLLLAETPFKQGDWLKISETEGKVIDMNWRAVRLQTIEGNVVIIPNGVLGKETILNYNLPHPAMGIWFEIGFSYNDPPNKVKKILRQALMETKGVVHDRGLKLISTGSYDDFSITYRVMFMTPNYLSSYKVGNDFRSRLYYLAKRHGLTIPFPIRHVHHTKLEPVNLEDRPQKIAEYLQSLPYFEGIECEIIEKLALDGEVEYYGLGEPIVQQGELVEGLYIIEQGCATLAFQDIRGRQHTVARVSKGDFFGESVFVSDKTSAVSVSATQDLQVIRLDADAVATLIAERPLFTKQIDELIDARRKTLRQLRGLERGEVENTAIDESLTGGSILDRFRSARNRQDA